MSSRSTTMPEVTKGDLDMISCVADTGIAEVNEPSFLRRSGRLIKTSPVPVVQTPMSKEDTAQAAIMPVRARRIAAMKGKVTTTAGHKISAKVEPSIGTKTLVVTGLTGDHIAMADTPKFSEAIATEATKVFNSAGRNSLVNRPKLPTTASSTSAAVQQHGSATSDEQDTQSDTGDSDEEMSTVIDDAHDSDFVPEAALFENVSSGLFSQTTLGGALPVSPPASDDASSSSKKRKTDSSHPDNASSKKRSKPVKNSAKAKPSDEEQLVVRPKGPSPHGKPLVWAEGRQALCETLDYYRAYQSGGYTLNGVGYGFLLDKDAGERSYMDEEVVIARCGGGVAKNEDGHMEQAVDQRSDDARVASWTYNMRNKVPVVLIVGSNNDHCPSEIPHRYCVMDYFQVTDIWAEQANHKTVFKLRFEKIYLDEKSWWAVQGSPPPPQERDFDTKAERLVCTQCDEPSTQVFQQDWMCLNDHCSRFWSINGVKAPKNLTYNAAFLQERKQWPKSLTMPYSLKPEPLAPDTGDDAGYAVSRVCWKGVACPKCGRCNSRVHWDAWRCETGGCGFTHTVKQCILGPRAVLGDHEIEYTGHAMLKDICAPSVNLREHELIGDWRVNTFDLLPGNLVTHFCSNSIINKKPSGPDQLFRDLQGTDIALQRYALSQSSLAGPALTKHFTANFGMPYKYVVDQETTSLAEAPRFILNALHRLTWAGEQTVKDGSFKKFNEVLTLGYLEKQAIGYHDDGEKELGPTIATLSLGCKAIMYLRIKATHYWGISKTDRYDPNAPVLPGCYKEHERRALNAKAQTLTETEFEKERKAIYEGSKGRRLTTPVLLTIHLHHGDMVIMHGAAMQKYYEHSIVPENKLRFALTGRYIRPELIHPENHWKGDYTPDPELIYNGDLPTTPADAGVAVGAINSSSADAEVVPAST